LTVFNMVALAPPQPEQLEQLRRQHGVTVLAALALLDSEQHSLAGGDDGLEREEHGGVKWHFHYIDARHQRSDVILSFDMRWKSVKSAKGPDRLRPLFVERHAEGKAKFAAHPGRWETEKRTSMYEICSRDLHKGIEHFRCAKNGSDAVWPRDATLTPHPSSLPNTAAAAAIRKKKNGR
jgi:hypothetical protein